MRTAPREIKGLWSDSSISSVLFVHTNSKDGPGKRTAATKDFSFAP
jgi:hypothetical protein